MALDVQLPEQRRELNRGPAPGLESAAGRPTSQQLFRFGKRNPRVVGDPSGGEAGGATADAIRFEQDDLDAGRGKWVRRGAAGEPAADDDGIDGGRPAEPRE